MKVLITAGASWIKVDALRILTSRFTGKTGLYLAKELKKKGHSVTLVINSHCLDRVKEVKVISYKYFDELKRAVVGALKNSRYDAIIHTAAVSDYRVKNVYQGKISSKKKSLNLQLIPTEKIIKKIRALAKQSLLIQFKLESKRRGLIKNAYQSLRENNSDYVVANVLEDLNPGYKGLVIDKSRKVILVKSKRSLVNVLDKIVRLDYNK